MNDDGTLHWDHSYDPVKLYNNAVNVVDKKTIVDKVAGSDGYFGLGKCGIVVPPTTVELEHLSLQQNQILQTILNDVIESVYDPLQ